MTNIGSTSSEFVETPAGIFTRNGNWYYVTSDHIDQIAPGLTNIISTDTLVDNAEIWIKSTDAVSLIVFIITIQLLPVSIAAILSLIFLMVWHLSKSAMISMWLTSLLKIITNDVLVLVVAVISISYLGIEGDYQGVLIGLLFFMIFRFGWARKLFDSFYTKYHQSISLNDRVMKMLIIKTAIANHVPVPGIQRMEQNILDLMIRHKKKPK